MIVWTGFDSRVPLGIGLLTTAVSVGCLAAGCSYSTRRSTVETSNRGPNVGENVNALKGVLLIARIAVPGHFLLILGCVAGFLGMRPGMRQWGELSPGGILAVGYFVAIIVTTGPQYTFGC
jgi:hypothetical protein